MKQAIAAVSMAATAVATTERFIKTAPTRLRCSGEWAFLYHGILYLSLATFSMEAAIWEMKFPLFIWQVSALSALLFTFSVQLRGAVRGLWRLLFSTMKTLEPKRAENKAEKAAVNGSAEDATVSAPSVQIDLSKVKIEPLFADDVDFETFSKSDFRVVKIEACEAVPKSKKLLKFTLNDGTDRKRTILSGIHEYYEPEELVGKTCVAITNLPPRKMMGIDSEGMLISAVYEYDGREGLNLLMLDDSIPAGAKLY